MPASLGAALGGNCPQSLADTFGQHTKVAPGPFPC